MSKRNCPLCPPNISHAEHRRIWSRQQVEGYSSVLSYLHQQGYSLSTAEIHAHFDHHRPRQAAAEERWRSRKALEEGQKLRGRLPKILDLAFRVPGLTAKEIGHALYWNGSPEKIPASEKAAARSLRKLLPNHFLHRIYLDNLSGPGIKPEEFAAMFYLGANGRALLEEKYQISIDYKHWLAEDKQLGDWPEVYANYQAASAMAGLHLQMPGQGGHHRYLENKAGVRVSWPNDNWLGPNLTSFRFLALSKEKIRLNPSGLLAWSVQQSVTDDEKHLPIFYYHLRKTRDVNKINQIIYNHQLLARAGETKLLLPDVPVDLSLPILLIAENQKILNQVLRTVKMEKDDATNVLLANSEHLAEHGLTSPCWYPLHKKLLPGQSLSAVFLLTELLANYHKKLLNGKKITWNYLS